MAAKSKTKGSSENTNSKSPNKGGISKWQKAMAKKNRKKLEKQQRQSSRGRTGKAVGEGKGPKGGQEEGEGGKRVKNTWKYDRKKIIAKRLKEEAMMEEGGGKGEERRDIIGRKRGRSVDEKMKKKDGFGKGGGLEDGKGGKPNSFERKKNERMRREEERYEIVLRSKKLWETLRTQKKGQSETAGKLVDQIYDLLSGRLLEFCFRHDASRVIQSLLKFGNKTQKGKVHKELVDECEREDWVRLVNDRYGRHLGSKIVKSGGKVVLNKVFENFIMGNVGNMMKGVYGARWLDDIWQTMLNGRQRKRVLIELLFAREKKLYDQVVLPKMKVNKTKGIEGDQEELSLKNALDVVGIEFAPMVLRNAKSYLMYLIEKQSIFESAMVHSGILEYLNMLLIHRRDEPAAVTSFAESLAPSLVHLAHTKPGATASVLIIKLLSAKLRKQAVRSFKTHVRKVLEDDSGHIVLIALFALVDDTVLLNKQLAQELVMKPSLLGAAQPKKKAKVKTKEAEDWEYLSTLPKHPHARMLFIYLLHGLDSRYFNPDLYGAIRKPLEEPFAETSKKDHEVRRKEILQLFLPVLKHLCAADRLESLMVETKSAPVCIGLCKNEELVEEVTKGLRDIVSDDKRRTAVCGTVCGKKTLVTMVKVGEESVANGLAELDTEVLLDAGMRFVKVILERGIDEKLAKEIANAITEE